MTQIRVLLVDDHAVLRAGIRAILEAEDDIEVVGEAATGDEAVQAVRQLSPDVTLMDVAMPGMNGLVATRYIIEEWKNARIIILSQYGNAEYVFPLLEAGASGYVLKQAADTDVIRAIRAVHKGESFLYPPIAKLLLDSYKSGGAGADAYATLTPRERDVLILVAEGYTNREIADILHISAKTVDVHRSNMMSKLDLHRVTDVLRFALRRGLIDRDGM